MAILGSGRADGYYLLTDRLIIGIYVLSAQAGPSGSR